MKFIWFKKKKIYFKITEALERVKQETEEKGSSMTDGGKYVFASNQTPIFSVTVT